MAKIALINLVSVIILLFIIVTRIFFLIMDPSNAGGWMLFLFCIAFIIVLGQNKWGFIWMLVLGIVDLSLSIGDGSWKLIWIPVDVLIIVLGLIGLFSRQTKFSGARWR